MAGPETAPEFLALIGMAVLVYGRYALYQVVGR